MMYEGSVGACRIGQSSMLTGATLPTSSYMSLLQQAPAVLARDGHGCAGASLPTMSLFVETRPTRSRPTLLLDCPPKNVFVRGKKLLRVSEALPTDKHYDHTGTFQPSCVAIKGTTASLNTTCFFLKRTSPNHGPIATLSPWLDRILG